MFNFVKKEIAILGYARFTGRKLLLFLFYRKKTCSTVLDATKGDMS